MERSVNPAGGRAQAPSPARLLEAAVAHHRDGRLELAEDIYRQVLGNAPGNPEAQHLLGVLALQRGDPASAVELIARAARKKPRDVQVLSNLGTAYRMLGLLDDAERAFRKSCALARGNADVHIKLGLTLLENGNVDAALDIFEKAVVLAPDDAPLFVTIARAYAARHDYPEALSACDEALSIDPHCADALIFRGRILLLLGRASEALETLEQARCTAPENAVALAAHGQALRATGDMDGAEEAFREAISLSASDAESGARDGLRLCAGTWFDLSQLAARRTEAHDVEEIRALRERIDDDDPGAVQLDFALARILEDEGDLEAAAELYARANALERASFEYDIGGACDRLAALPGEVPAALNSGDDDEAAGPVFVVGMPRSGTTLVARILGSHRDLAAAGGLPYIEALAASATAGNLAELRDRYLSRIAHHSADGLRPVDRAPLNFRYVGLIRAMFPEARIVHAVRDPLDTCVSCWRQLFADRVPFAYDLEELGRYYLAYRRLMARWHEMYPGAILDVRYDSLVADTESEIAKLLDFVGVGWDDACMRSHETGRAVLTASAAQVRRPIREIATARWRAMPEPFVPLVAVLDGGDGLNEAA